MNKFFDRLREPSTWGGIAISILGIGQLAKLDHTEEIAGAVQTMGEGIGAAGGTMESIVTGGFGLLAGIFSIFMREKGER